MANRPERIATANWACEPQLVSERLSEVRKFRDGIRISVSHLTNGKSLTLLAPDLAKYLGLGSATLPIESDSTIMDALQHLSNIESLSMQPLLRNYLPQYRRSIAGLLLVSSLIAGRPPQPNSCYASEPTSQTPKVSEWIERFSADLQSLRHRYRIPLDQAAMNVQKQTISEWLTLLKQADFAALDRVGQIDYLLLKSELEYRRDKLELDQKRDEAALPFIPYAKEIVEFLKTREDVEPIDASKLASQLDSLAANIEQEALKVRASGKPDNAVATSAEDTATKLNALHAASLIAGFQRSIKEADNFYRGYDPQYSWWVTKPMERFTASLEQHRASLRNHIVGVPDSDNDTIIGLPIGEQGLALELKHEWIAHSPAELVELAKREMAWCDEQMAAASKELGCGDDWRAAMDLVKSRHVQPGEQPQMIRDLAWEAIRFLEAHDLVTVPALAANGWRMTMMSPERQRVNPYFLGGDTIIVSFPTDSMTHDEKLMSMRSNNEHFSRATVHHELIPGHHLQYYMLPRHRPYRQLFGTPFWMEGWALYWEMLLWDLDFAHGPEDRVGMLFWRKHRCARIIFSLSYHLGTMSPEECVDYLVERVGHERSAASAEVRRSIMGGYSPLYQAAYMLGGLQLRAMHKEFVQSGKMTNREFHDAVLHEHSIPIEVLRLYLSDSELSPNTASEWRFATKPQ